jgi:hypothetical protein
MPVDPLRDALRDVSEAVFPWDRPHLASTRRQRLFACAAVRSSLEAGLYANAEDIAALLHKAERDADAVRSKGGKVRPVPAPSGLTAQFEAGDLGLTSASGPPVAREIAVAELRQLCYGDLAYASLFMLVTPLPTPAARRLALARCVFGALVDPPGAAGVGLPARGGPALALAKQIYAARAWGQLPVLADALEEAGCDAPGALAHLRDPGPHARGCWALDLVLGKD